jgi:thiol-disulfide isomerase/thioredoxin
MNKMKKLLWTICIWFVAGLLPAESKENRNTQFAVVTGSILESGDYAVQGSLFDGDELLSPPPVFSTRSHNGRFKMVIPLDKPTDMVLEIDGQPVLSNITGFGILLEPGDSIDIEIPRIKGCKITDALFSGRGSEKYIFLQRMRKVIDDIKCDGNPWDRSLSQRIDCYLLHQRATDSLLENYAQDGISINRQVRSQVLMSLGNSVILSFMMNSKDDPNRNELYSSRVARDMPFEELLAEGALYKGSLLFNALYDRTTLDLMSEGIISPTREEKFNAAKEKYKFSPVRDWLLATCIASLSKVEGWSNEVEEMYDVFIKLKPQKLYLTQLIKLRRIMRDQLAAGKTAIDFILNDTVGNKFSMKDFRGKVVLMDFVLTGCGGCASMVPELDKLKNYFKDSDIVFVSIAVDGSVEQTKQGIGKFSSAGSILLYANGEGTNHPILAYYKVNSFPTLVLIDKRGRIISARAPDPRQQSSKLKLYELITSNL